MRHTKLFWKVFPAFLGIVIISLLALGWFASHELSAFFMDRMQANLEKRAKLVAHYIQSRYSLTDQEQIHQTCHRVGELTDSRITIVDPDGTVLGDSHVQWNRVDLNSEDRIENHADRPEIRAAMEGQTGVQPRYSTTLEQKMVYVAVPLIIDGEMAGVVRASRSLQSFEEALSAIQFKITMGGIFVGLLAVLISLAASRRLTRPLSEIRRGVMRFADGDLQTRLPSFDVEEFQLLAQTMNQMAAYLDDRIRTVIQQRNEVEAILCSMAEGVLAVDTEDKIIKLNRTAAEMLNVRLQEAEGKTVQSLVRNASLHRALSQTLAQEEPVTDRIVFYNEEERYFQVNGALVKDAMGNTMGAVLVLNDITQMRKLENIRKDFVANVSHEIRTPITSIQGFVETLLDGAMEDQHDARRFLDIILKQANRLNAIIEDLLLLSRVEREGEQPSLQFEHHKLRDILLTAVQVCEHKAKDKGVEIELDCPQDIFADLNPLLMEQAIVNIIDNAINYSDPDSRISVSAAADTGEIVLSVTDRGCGIPSDHLPRIFERFYRVDKARSRQLGGTGLGLAILKHVAQAHGGRVSVDSKVGEGSTFRIHLPQASPA